MKNQISGIALKNQSSEWDDGIFAVLSLSVILIPVLFYPRSFTIFDPIKNTTFQLLALIGLSLWALKKISGEISESGLFSLNMNVFLFVLFGSLSLIWSVNIHRSLLTLPLFLAGPVLFFLASGSIHSQKRINLLLFFILFMGAGMGIYGVLQYFGIDFSLWTGNVGRQQVFGLFGNVNYFAEYLILPLALAVGLFLFGHKPVIFRLFLFLSIVSMSLALFFTLTRSSYLGIAVAVAVMIFFYSISTGQQQNKKYTRKIILGLIIAVFILLAMIYVPHHLNQKGTFLGRLQERVTIGNPLSDYSTVRRIAIWKFTWMMIQDHPLLGSGLGTYGYHTLDYQAQFFSRENNRDTYPHGNAIQAHNEYLQLWSELGIIGLSLFLFILFIYFRGILIHLRRIEGEEKGIILGLTGGITAVLIDSLFGFPLQLAGSLSLFWLFMGLTIAQIHLARSGQTREENVSQTRSGQKALANEENKAGGKVIIKIVLSIFVILMMIGAMSLIIRPFMGRVYWYYGIRQTTRGNQNEAIRLYEKGLEWNPWQGEMYFDIANILLNKGISNLALEYYLRGQKHADHPNLPQNIGALYLKLGDQEKAIPYLEKSILYQSSRRRMLPLQIQLGNIYLAKGDDKNASRHFASAVENNPESAEAYYGLAGVYTHQGEKEKTIENLKKVIEIDPESRLAGFAKTMLTKIELEERKKETDEEQQKNQ